MVTTAPPPLILPELLHHILEHADHLTLAVCLRVCKLWWHIAVGYLWKNLSDLTPLMNLLVAVIKAERNGIWSASQANLLPDWSRYELYANHVRYIKHVDTPFELDTSQDETIHSTLFPSIILHQPTDMHLSPRVTALDWSAHHRHTIQELVHFISPTLKRLTIVSSLLEYSPEYIFLIRQLTLKKMVLTDLKLLIDVNVLKIRHVLVPWLYSLRKLESIQLLQEFFCIEVTKALGRLPNLRYIGSFPVANTSRPDPSRLQFDFPKSSFPALASLELASSHKRLSTILSQVLPPSLCNIALRCRRMGARNDLFDTNHLLASACPGLRKLCLDLYGPVSDHPTPISFYSLKPLLRCTQIEDMSVLHNWPLNMDVAALELMGRSWPKLKKLTLCPNPQCDHEPSGGIPLDSLLRIAPNFMNLEHLSLYLSKDLIPISNFDTAIIFPKLRSLNFGTSPLPHESNPRATADVLGHICLPGLTISFDEETWRKFIVISSPEHDVICEARLAAWKPIPGLVEWFHETLAEREREVQALRRRVELLEKENQRIRNGVTMLAALVGEEV